MENPTFAYTLPEAGRIYLEIADPKFSHKDPPRAGRYLRGRFPNVSNEDLLSNMASGFSNSVSLITGLVVIEHPLVRDLDSLHLRRTLYETAQYKEYAHLKRSGDPKEDFGPYDIREIRALQQLQANLTETHPNADGTRAENPLGLEGWKNLRPPDSPGDLITDAILRCAEQTGVMLLRAEILGKQDPRYSTTIKIADAYIEAGQKIREVLDDLVKEIKES